MGFIGRGINTVRTVGNQIINGSKMFTQYIVQGNPALTKGTNPDSTQYFGVQFNDKNGKGPVNSIGVAGASVSTAGKTSAYVGAYQFINGNSNFEHISVYYPKSGAAYTYAPAPTDTTATDGTQIATTGWVNSTGNNVVHLTDTETISGSKTFTDDPIIKNSSARIYFDDTSQTKGTAPSSTMSNALFFRDNDGKNMSLIKQMYTAEKVCKLELGAYKSNSASDTETSSIIVYYPASGDPYATAPASDVNGSILTTVSKTKAQNGYLKLGNKIIMQWGYCAGSVTTITFPTPFGNTNYAVTCTHTGDANRAITVQSSSKTTTSINAVKNSGDAFYWLAFGYEG